MKTLETIKVEISTYPVVKNVLTG